MLTMEQIYLIKYLRNYKAKSLCKIAEETGHDFQTVKKSVEKGGNSSVAIGNKIKGTRVGTYTIFDEYFNHFVGGNNIVCNRREGIENNGQFELIYNNEISYSGDSGILLGTTSLLNLVMHNKLRCNIPGNIDDRGIDNNIINNVEKPCDPCEAPSDVCDNCPHATHKDMDGPEEGVE
ncbi:MAG: hypothetical protein GX892_04060 [Thermoanaerobacteraceae bacterium]|nr:hypothetical protein [Thermoanaerobacteraceae bacterium]